MTRQRSPFVYTRPVRDDTVDLAGSIPVGGYGSRLHHAFIRGERVPDIEIFSYVVEVIAYPRRSRHGMPRWRYEVLNHREYGWFDKASDAVHAAAKHDRALVKWLASRGEPNASWFPKEPCEICGSTRTNRWNETLHFAPDCTK